MMMKKKQNKKRPILELLQSTYIRSITLDNLLLKLLFVAALVFMTVWIMPTERPFQYSNLTINKVAPEEIIAPFKFAIQKNTEELERARALARLSVPPVFERNIDTSDRTLLTLKQFVDEVQAFLERQNQKINGVAGDSLVQQKRAAVDSLISSITVRYGIQLDFEDILDFYEIQRAGNLYIWYNRLQATLENVFQQGILDRSKAEIPELLIGVSEKGIETAHSPEDLLEIREARDYIINIMDVRFPKNRPLLSLTDELLADFLTPNLVYNASITISRKEEAVHDVPITRGYVEQDERIVDSNEKITDEVYQKLVSLEYELKTRSAAQEGWYAVKFKFGQLLFAIIIIFLTVFYLYFYRRSIFKSNRMLGMITLILLLQLIAAGLIQSFTEWSPLTIPVILAPMLLAMVLDFGVAFIGVVAMSLIMGSTLAYSYEFTFMSMIVGSISVFSVQKIRNRGQMFRAILFILLGYMVVHFVFGLMHYMPMKEVFFEFVYYLLPNAILTPTIVYFMIGIFERYFDVTTDITLLELSDLNHPLLKQLSVKAPGSFHHSIVVANLAEAGAIAIRANALLTRVGSYFHDVGKMDKPEYFVENQRPGVNKHDNLSPHMSYLILINHVKEGLKMAEKYNLPNAVKQFIAEHHGSSLVSFFYYKARENAEVTEVRESDFRYPGPKPQSKETAICMMADTIEAASRVLKGPTPQRIRNLVDELVEHKIKEDQMDECGLTFQDIASIKEAFIPILTGIHHIRIEYPEGDPDKRQSREKGEKPQAARDINPKEQNGSPEKPSPTLENGDAENRTPPDNIDDDRHADTS